MAGGTTKDGRRAGVFEAKRRLRTEGAATFILLMLRSCKTDCCELSQLGKRRARRRGGRLDSSLAKVTSADCNPLTVERLGRFIIAHRISDDTFVSMKDTDELASQDGDTSRSPAWLLCVPQLPAKPDYLRVKLQRRVRRIGAAALKNSVYILPNLPETTEDLEWLRRELVADGGDALIWAASCVAGSTDTALQRLFRDLSDDEFRTIEMEARQLGEPVSAVSNSADSRSDITRLRRRFHDAVKADWFGSLARNAAEVALQALERRDADVMDRPKTLSRISESALAGQTWVTRQGSSSIESQARG